MAGGKVSRAALYHRVSTVDQNSSGARSELQRGAKRFGLNAVLRVEETGTGANNNRPGLLRVLDAARRREIDAVLVWKLDRFGRSAFDLLANLQQLERAGVRFIALTQGIDIKPGGDAMSRLMLTMLSAVAEFERDLIVERTRLGLARARQMGIRLGRPPVNKPPRAKVQQLKTAGRTWLEISEALGCTVWAARSAANNRGEKTRSQTQAGRKLR